MKSWTPTPPQKSSLSDHDVEVLGSYLKGKRIALLVCGGIAAMKAPLLARALRRYEAEVIAYVSQEALKYTTIDALEWSTYNKVITQLSPQSEHLSKDQPFDAYLVAPATYNTINKLRHGIADSPVTTTLASALSLVSTGKTQIFIAPTMHGDFHNPIFEESINYLSQLGVKIIPPRDDYGKHNLPDVRDISAFVCHHMSESPLRGKKILVTAGSTPVFIDDVRCISNRFRGRLGLEISRHLHFLGAQVLHIYGSGSIEPDGYLQSAKTKDYEDYKSTVLNVLQDGSFAYGIFSAAVADYQPKERFKGKVKSGGALQSIELVPTEKVIDLVQEQFRDLKMITFKFESDISLEDLVQIGKQRLERGHLAVVVNRAEDFTSEDGQKAYLVTRDQEVLEMNSKPEISQLLVKYIEGTI